MFRLDELSGHLIKSGRFKDAIDKFYFELDTAKTLGVITYDEFYFLSRQFAFILLNPSDYKEVEALGNKMLNLAIRIPGKLPIVSEEEFKKNVKQSREDNSPKD